MNNFIENTFWGENKMGYNGTPKPSTEVLLSTLSSSSAVNVRALYTEIISLSIKKYLILKTL